MMLHGLVKRPLPRSEEFEILSNFRTYFLDKFLNRVKNSANKSISRLELEKSRIEEERSRFEAELARKSSQMKSLILYATSVVLLIAAFTMWRVWWKNRRIQALQDYI